MIDLSGRVIVLDLDDTLYLERDYARSGFEAIGAWIEERHAIRGFGGACQDLFDKGIRRAIFDHALADLKQADRMPSVNELVEVYRSHKPQIRLAPDAAHLLRRLRGVPGALITDGPLICQRNKTEALRLGNYLKRIILTASLGPDCGKPHPLAFELVEEWSRRAPEDHVYIADNPTKDFVEPRRRGWLTVQIQRPERVHFELAPTPAHTAVYAIESLDEIRVR
ncbi:HAD family hydrolase [Novosphingobium panipatense]|jgi:putative hydrolase of the HAD superfamily|uniref:Hydrolase of the HAD superfamily n=1 Tax=Novosphingobium panipatense TaxID=428991 RepID=A0ABY1QKQ6_9SPHN|nr:HAD family hydrolase [Novosphingobium panipatense]SMP71827.1 putative hydrolase of the HAD superfamily [Novosphingobium panipatense]